MTITDFKKYIKTVPTNILIGFGGFSEPFSNPECVDMIIYAYQKGHKIYMSTTAVGMTMEDINRLKMVKFERIVLHLPDAEGNTKIPTSDEHLKLVTYLKETIPTSHFLCMAMGHLHPKFKNAFNNVDNPYYPISNEFPASSRLNKFPNPSSRAGLVSCVKSPRNYGSIKCVVEFENIGNYLFPDGRVNICHQDWQLKYVLGNLNESSYEDIIKSPKFFEMQSDMKKFWENRTMCRKCEWARPTLPFFFFNFHFLINYFRLRIGNKKLLKRSISILTRKIKRVISRIKL
jgi:radical SAM protein with 4Fe4S-binding SPASM domain